MNDSARSVLVLGANGRFGASAVRAFSSAGWSVTAQARRPLLSPPAGTRYLATPIADVATLAREARGASVVAYAVNPPYTRWTSEALPFARSAMDLARRLDARFLIPGNVYNFGEHMPPVLQEDAPQQPTSRKGRIRVELENELAARAADGLRSVIVRAGDYFGSGTGSWLDLTVLRSVHKGKLVYPGPLDVAHSWAYLPDFARTCVAVASLDDLPDFARFHFAGHTLTGAELLDAVERAADALGLRPARGWRRGTLPWPLFRAGGLVVPMLREVVEMAYLWRVPHALDDTLLQRAVGAIPPTPLEQAMRDALRALGLGDRVAPR